MPTEGEDFLSGRRVPQLDGPVVATRGQAPAVRTVGQAFDQCGVSAKVEHSPRGKVPDLHFTELRCTRDRRSTTGRGKSAVRKEHHAFHLTGVSRELVRSQGDIARFRCESSQALFGACPAEGVVLWHAPCD